jgi:hypothetical protein
VTGNSVIGALRVDLSLDTAAFETGIKSAKDKMPAFAGALKGMGVAALAGLATAAAAAGAAMVKFGFDSLAVADDIGDTAARLGITSSEFQKLNIAAQKAGGSPELMTEAMDKLNVSLGQFQQTGGGKAKEAFNQLGLATQIASGQLKTADQVFYASVDALSKVSDPAQKAALSMQLFGKSAGVDMLEVTAAGSEALKGFGDAAARSGQVMSDELVTKLADAKLKLDDAKRGASAMATVFAGEALVSIMQYAESLKPAIAEGMKIANTVIDFMMPAIKELGVAFVNFAQGPTGQFLIGALKTLAGLLGGTVVIAAKLLIQTVTVLFNALDGMGKFIQGFVDRVKIAFVDLTKVLMAVLNPIQTVQKAFFTLYDKVVGRSYVPDMVDGIASEFARLPKVMTNVALGEVAKVNDAFAGIGLKTLYKTPSQSRPDLPDEDLKTMGNGMTEAIMQSREDLKRNFAETFSDGLRAALSGDFGGWFEDWWKNKLNRVLTDAFDKLGGMIFEKLGGGSGGGIGGILGSIFGDSPAFAKGGTVGFKGGGGTDSRLFSAWVSPSELVSIGHPSDMMGGSMITLPIYVGGDKIDERIIEISGNVARDITGKTIAGAAKSSARSQSYRLG